MKTWPLCASLLFVAQFAAQAAETKVEDARVSRILATEDDRFGGCMALLSRDEYIDAIVADSLDCRATSWVTFDCAGQFVSKAAGTRMFDAAQLAFLTKSPAEVTVDDTRKHGGWCLAKRIDVWPAPEPEAE